MTNYRQILAACAVLACASPLAAQQVAASLQTIGLPTVAIATTHAPAPAPDDMRPVLGPAASSTIAGVRIQADATAPAPVAAVQSVGRNPALMIVGVTALVIGAVIGDKPGTIVMVGGGVVGLLGLWRYLQ